MFVDARKLGLIFTALIFCGLIIGYFYLNQLFYLSENSNSTRIKAQELDVSTPQQLTTQTEKNHSTNNLEQQFDTRPNPPKSEMPSTVLGTPAEAVEVKKWFAERGDFRGKKDIEYASYNFETLESLAEQGDLRAMHVLANLYLEGDNLHKKGYGFEGAKNLYGKAAIYGSTEALVRLASLHDVRVYNDAKKPDEKKAAALEILALYNTAALRGNMYPNLVHAHTFRKSLDFKLSIEDEKFIEKRSGIIYGYMQEKRYELGLGDFDNSVPDSVKRYFERYQSSVAQGGL